MNCSDILQIAVIDSELGAGQMNSPSQIYGLNLQPEVHLLPMPQMLLNNLFLKCLYILL